MKLKIDTIVPNPQQPRAINQEKLESLAASIEQVGLINPIAVEDNADGTYTLIDGEHRWRACQMAGLLYRGWCHRRYYRSHISEISKGQRGANDNIPTPR